MLVGSFTQHKILNLDGKKTLFGVVFSLITTRSSYVGICY